MIFVASSSEGRDGLPIVFAVPGDLAPGDHDLFDVWAGGGWGNGWPNTVVNAGDVNHDGMLDLWLANALFLGPFLEELLPFGDIVPDEAAAWIDGGEVEVEPGVTKPRWGKENAIAGGADLDGDGEIDLVTQVDRGSQGFIHYGPFAGPIPSAFWDLADPASYTSFGEDVGCDPSEGNSRGTWLRDHLGPGHDGIAIGSNPTGFCQWVAFLWDPVQPRGTHLTYDQSYARTYVSSTSPADSGVYDPGDADGDGDHDLVLTEDLGGVVAAGPISGIVTLPPEVELAADHGRISKAVGDINGDGAPELVAQWWSEDETEATYGYGSWILLFSPFEFPIDLSRDGLVLGNADGHVWVIGQDSPDLDGDGLADLVDGDPVFTSSVSIWYGKDLRAAWEARTAAD